MALLSMSLWPSDVENLRIALLGKTGSGKSSLANTIFGETVFDICHTANSGTSACKKATKEVNGTSISLIDTPGFFDNSKSEKELKNEIAKCIVECSPGPHAFLILLKVEKFTEQEAEVISKITESFSEEALKYAVVVFTHGDQLPERMQIKQYINENNKLRELLEKCGGRCHVFDNKYWNNNQQDAYRNNKLHVEKLINTIKEMVRKSNGGCYTNDMLREVERRIQQEEERIRASSRNMSQEAIREQAKNTVSNILKKAAGITTGILLGALLGVGAMVISVIVVLETLNMPVKPLVGAAVSGGTVTATGVGLCAATGVFATAGAIGGGCIGYHEADQADSVGEAIANTAKALGKLAIKPVEAMSNRKQESNQEGWF